MLTINNCNCNAAAIVAVVVVAVMLINRKENRDALLLELNCSTGLGTIQQHVVVNEAVYFYFVLQNNSNLVTSYLALEVFSWLL